jgi:hypothetical protein
MDTFEWDDLRYLLAFARAGSMQAAAKAAKGHKYKITLVEKFNAVYDNLDAVDGAKAMTCIAANNSEDAVIGGYSQKAQSSWGDAQSATFGKSGRSIGITVGPTL